MPSSMNRRCHSVFCGKLLRGKEEIIEEHQSSSDRNALPPHSRVLFIESSTRSTVCTAAPGGLMFRPVIANQIEPRCGVDKLLDSNALTLNIGNSFDLLSWKTMQSGKAFANEQEWRIGTDLFTWTLIRAEGDFRFPVEEVNYLFGLNTTWMSVYQTTANSFPIVNSFRLRISHISAHTVDGMYDNYTQQFTYQEPFHIH